MGSYHYLFGLYTDYYGQFEFAYLGLFTDVNTYELRLMRLFERAYEIGLFPLALQDSL
jgi:hypothetical protein